VHRLTPKLVIALREGYSFKQFGSDALGGLTVAIIALPLAMALGIASIPAEVAEQLKATYGSWLTPPAMGLFTAVVAGFLISALGGSRVQVGGPTAAFIPIVFGIAAAHGYQGLVVATIMAGVIVALMGVFGFGAMIKFIPYPVTTGFTTGIAVTIIASQIKDFFGLTLADAAGKPVSMPADFLPKVILLAKNFGSMSWQTAVIGVGSLAILVVLRRFVPRLPGAIVAVTVSAVVVAVMKWAEASQGGEVLVQTIGTKFNGIPRMLPAPHAPAFTFELVKEMVLPATTIAILCAIESLLSAVVSDGMTGYRHKSDTELVAQGFANIASGLFFGVPATGAIARTVANIKNGGKTPVAGMLHAVFLLLFMVVASKLAAYIPLATLSAILIVVAWNIAELDHFRAILKAPRADVLVLLTTFGLTVFFDLTIAVTVGMVIASLLFMKRMSEVSNVSAIAKDYSEQGDEPGETISDLKDPESVSKADIPHGVEVYEIAGPFFFGVADRLKDTLNLVERPPRVFILRMRKVPAIDATGLHALKEFHAKCKRQHIRLMLSGVHAQPLFAIVQAGFDQVVGVENMFDTLHDAIVAARDALAAGPVAEPQARAKGVA
jgi:SulP family sulfate permease